MGSGGGGSAGKVEYPAYLQTFHSKILDSDATDALSFSAVDLLNDAYAINPFDAAISYDGRIDIGTVPLTIAATLQEVLSYDLDVLDDFSSSLTSVASNVKSLFSPTTLQEAVAQYQEENDDEYHKALSVFEAEQVQAGNVYSSVFVLGKAMILDAKMKKTMTNSLEDLSKGILQLADNIFADTMSHVEILQQNFRVTKSSYAMAVEMVKLTLLNEREYFEQNEYYLKHKAVWRFEEVQEILNAIGIQRMGRRLEVKSPSALLTTMGYIAGFGAGDPIGLLLYRGSKRFRYAAIGAGQGMQATWSIGPIGLIIGGVYGFVNNYSSYQQGDVR